MQAATETPSAIVEPNIRIDKLPANEIGEMEGGFSASIFLPNVTIQKIHTIFSKTKMWHEMFAPVTLALEEQGTIPKEIAVGLSGTAQSSLEPVPAFYEIEVIEKDDDHMLVKVRLKKCEANTQNDIYFKDLLGIFLFTSGNQGVNYSVNMQYLRNNLLSNKAKDVLLNFENIMQAALKNSMHTAFSKICDPASKALRKKIKNELQITPISAGDLPQAYAGGVQGSWLIPTTSDKVLAVLCDVKEYNKLHPNFPAIEKSHTQDEQSQLSFNFIKVNFPLRLEKINEQTIELTSLDQNFLKSIYKGTFFSSLLADLKLKFVTQSQGNETLLTISFMHKLMSSIRDLTGPAVNDAASKLIRTMERRMVQKFMHDLTPDNNNNNTLRLEDEVSTPSFTG
ncbi:MAG: hypothetical protein H0U71_08440 [Gammaproteobacteria bacterium]|nr:hypothetical protein [Gammaproteobacteria bacterium]